MKKSVIYFMAGAMLLASCDTYTGAGAYTGATFGSILGSAIGGISDGPRGSDIGTIVGMAGGAVLGAAIGQQADQAQSQKIRDRYQRIQQNKERGYNPYENRSSDRTRSNDNSNDEAYNFNGSSDDGSYNDSVDPTVVDTTNSGDDRITMSVGKPDDYSASVPTTVNPDSQSHFELIPEGVSYTPNIKIDNARFIDDNQDGFLSRGETAKVTFEIYNRGSQTLYNVIPSVMEASHNKHIRITPSIIVESLAPGRGITYTAFVKADSKLNDGTAKFALAVLQGKKSISKVTEFTVRTKK